MLIKRFSVGVEKDRAEEVMKIIMDNFGIEIIKACDYKESWLFGKETVITYFECYGPHERFKMLCEYLDNEFTGTAIIE